VTSWAVGRSFDVFVHFGSFGSFPLRAEHSVTAVDRDLVCSQAVTLYAVFDVIVN
jgi:hypothetical protein